MQKRVVLYLRVSSQSQVDNFSLENQEIVCRDYCDKNGYLIVKVFTEPGESAKTADRTEFQKMLLFCRKKENDINTVVFYHSSRFSRDTKDLLNIQADLARYAINLDSVTEPQIKESSPESKLYTTIVAGFNEYENSNRARNTSNGMKRRFLEGYPMTWPPLGYKLDKKPGEKSVAIPDSVWWPIIKNMWQRIIDERLSIRTVQKELNKYKLKKFSKTGVSKIFHNPFYYGMMRSNKYGEVTGRHEPMITKDVYYQVQAIFGGRSQPNQAKTHFRNDFMLRGILVCPECRHRLSSGWSKGKRQKYPYYLCSGRTHKIKNYPRDLVENKFRELLENLQPTKEYMDLRIALMLEKYEAKNKVILETKSQLAKDVTLLEEMLKTLKEKHLIKIYSDSDFLKLKDDLETRLIAKNSLLAEKTIDVDEIKLMTTWIKTFFTHLEKIFVAASPEVRQMLGCSIFPEGLFFKDGNFQTPKIARCYESKEDTSPSRETNVPTSFATSNTLLGICFRFIINQGICLDITINEYKTQKVNEDRMKIAK